MMTVKKYGSERRVIKFMNVTCDGLVFFVSARAGNKFRLVLPGKKRFPKKKVKNPVCKITGPVNLLSVNPRTELHHQLNDLKSAISWLKLHKLNFSFFSRQPRHVEFIKTRIREVDESM